MTLRTRPDDFERLFSEHARPLLKFLVFRTGDRALSEDLVSATFERVLNGRRAFDRRRASEKTWLYSIALNLLRDHARREAVASRAMERLVVSTSAAARSSELASVELRDELGRALAQLSVEEREVIALRYGADLTVPQMARLTRQKPKTIESRMYRALRKLKDEVSPSSD